MFFVGLVTLAAHLVIFVLLYCCRKRHRWLEYWYNRVKDTLFWNGTLLFIIEGYFALTLASLQ